MYYGLLVHGEKTAEFAVFKKFYHIIDKRIISEFQPPNCHVVNKIRVH